MICGAKLPSEEEKERIAQEKLRSIEERAAEIEEKLKRKALEDKEINEKGLIYNLDGARGRRLRVYEDRCEISTDVTVGSVLTGNVSDGEKTIFYADCIGLQFKKSGTLLGYLQVETAAPTMNNEKSNFFNENSFTFSENSNISNELVKEVYRYIKGRVALYKQIHASSFQSTPDEIRKYKELLDCEAITEEEYQKKKTELLNR